ncbi:3-phosphoinositide dependent protein kinase-1 [Perkinsus olseni]|uniref:non-specific serine/threonine protein kinase n=2 Tax=Perkinsus olseni TaxID=32597 RepID=A0A7J6RJ52_PEROL|nr:3-phosphoinositide dependent protein kinase-1 [Perkinsus olseni]
MRHYSRSDFEFGSLLGTGAFAQVVHVRDKTDGKEYALKILDKKTLERLDKTAQVLNERDTLMKLRDCDNIVKLYFTFQDRTWLYFALEYCEGGDLAEEIGRWGRVPEDLARFYAAEIVNMLVQLRSKGLAHRDLKPDNILINKGHLKLVDFDVAKATSPSLAYRCEKSAASGDTKSASTQSDDDSQLRRMNTFVGTAQYVSPEMLSDSAVAGFASDLWALGCIVYQMIVGYSPFQSGSEGQTFQMILSTQYDMPDDVSDAARDLIGKLLVLEPADRLGFGNLGELKAHPFFDGVDFATLPFTPPPRESHHYRNHQENGESLADDMGAEFGLAPHGVEISVDEDDDWSYDSDEDERTPMVGQVFGGRAQRIMPFNFVEAASAAVKSPRSSVGQHGGTRPGRQQQERPAETTTRTSCEEDADGR